MKLQGILSALSLVAVAGAAAPMCPEECEKNCCAQVKSEKIDLIEFTSDDDLPNLIELGDDDERIVKHVQSFMHKGDGDDQSVVVKIINDHVSAHVNGKEVDPSHVIHKDGKIIIQIEGHDDIVVPMMTGKNWGGNWATFADAAPGFKWHNGGDGNVFFAPEGAEDFVFQPSGGGKAIIGINIADADDDLLEQLDLDGAIRIEGVIDGTPAQKAGIKANDLLIRLDGKRTLNVERLREILSDKNPGDKVKVQVLRKGDNKTFEIKLAPSGGIGRFAPDEQVIELSPEFKVDVEKMIKDLDFGDANVEMNGEIRLKLHDHLQNKLKGLHIEMAPLHEKLQGKVFGELRHMAPQGNLMVTPRLRLHGNDGVFDLGDGKTGVFRFEGGNEGGTFRFKTDHENEFHFKHDDDLGARLNKLEDRLDSLERKLERLARALERE